jgi:DNA-binding transcriptional LysR family regulator
MHEYLAKKPFDVYELHLFRLVADQRSFTRAAQKARLTQSTMTRQIAGMESALGVSLFERTTRSVNLTPAGEILYERAEVILNQVAATIDDLRHAAGLLPKRLRVGIARSIAFAYLPGFIFRFQREQPDVQIDLVQDSSKQLLGMLEERTIDVAIFCAGPRVARGLEVVHRFADAFTIIAPASLLMKAAPLKPRHALRALCGQRWLMIRRESVTGSQVFPWLKRHEMEVAPAMELDSFDLIINMVSLGLGVSIVPHRALPLYLHRRRIRKIPLRPTFTREIAVAVRRTKHPRPHIQKFVESILF